MKLVDLKSLQELRLRKESFDCSLCFSIVAHVIAELGLLLDVDLTYMIRIVGDHVVVGFFDSLEELSEELEFLLQLFWVLLQVILEHFWLLLLGRWFGSGCLADCRGRPWGQRSLLRGRILLLFLLLLLFGFLLFFSLLVRKQEIELQHIVNLRIDHLLSLLFILLLSLLNVG